MIKIEFSHWNALVITSNPNISIKISKMMRRMKNGFGIFLRNLPIIESIEFLFRRVKEPKQLRKPLPSES